MTAYDDKHVQAAIGRLPGMASKDIRSLRGRGVEQGLVALVEACDLELAARPIEFSAIDAANHVEMAAAVSGLDFVDTVAAAFSRVRRPSEDEYRFLQWVYNHPGGSYQEAVVERGKGDVGLLIGHLIYDRFGCFRRFVKDGEDLSSLLLIKERSGPSVRYTLRDDAREGLQRAGVL
jgi:hypothetical protein